jgi:hypothetical protein
MQWHLQRDRIVSRAVGLHGPARRVDSIWGHGPLHCMGLPSQADSPRIRWLHGRDHIGSPATGRSADDVDRLPAGINARFRPRGPAMVAPTLGLRPFAPQRHADKPAPPPDDRTTPRSDSVVRTRYWSLSRAPGLYGALCGCRSRSSAANAVGWNPYVHAALRESARPATTFDQRSQMRTKDSNHLRRNESYGCAS